MTWDPTQIGDLRGRTYLITGANGGIGYFAADQLLRAGADVIVAGRNPAKLGDAISALSASAKVPAAGIGKLRIDTSSIESSTKAAAEITGRGIELDGLILNAGLVHGPKTRTVTPRVTNCSSRQTFSATLPLSGRSWIRSPVPRRTSCGWAAPPPSRGVLLHRSRIGRRRS